MWLSQNEDYDKWNASGTEMNKIKNWNKLCFMYILAARELKICARFSASSNWIQDETGED